jgi:hypothetical protein
LRIQTAGRIGVILAAIIAAAPFSAGAQIPVPIPGAGAWNLLKTLPGAPGRACTARINGPEIDTMLVFNNAGIPLLMAGRADWANLGGDVDVTLSIDGAPAEHLSASMLHNLIITMVSDPKRVARLRQARTLDWQLPFGRYRGNVTGLGVALDAMTACRRPDAANSPVD